MDLDKTFSIIISNVFVVVESEYEVDLPLTITVLA
jgi:hypothetical protein